MKLAEALAQRADATRSIDQLRARIAQNARYQEGSEPVEDATALLDQAERALTQLERLIAKINRTNLAAQLEPGVSLTDGLAQRDVLRLRHRLLTEAADAAAGAGEYGLGRQLKSELRTLSALDVADLRGRADQVSKQLRELDLRIQQANWAVDLAD